MDPGQRRGEDDADQKMNTLVGTLLHLQSWLLHCSTGIDVHKTDSSQVCVTFICKKDEVILI